VAPHDDTDFHKVSSVLRLSIDTGPRQWQAYFERERNARSGASTRLVE
jgi:hypothetical protein